MGAFARAELWCYVPSMNPVLSVLMVLGLFGLVMLFYGLYETTAEFLMTVVFIALGVIAVRKDEQLRKK